MPKVKATNLSERGSPRLCRRVRHAQFPMTNHHQLFLKIGIPLRQTAINVKWQTETEKQRYQFVKSGSISVVSPDLPHATWIEQPAEQLIISLSPESIAQVIDDLNFKPARIIPQWTAEDRFIEQLGLLLTEYRQVSSLINP
ncbi:hypothetical protein H1P_30022 [Hyella patelloides LEGE 07179]|uniref:Uncharacterized protein n=2 Tax=Hyella TaxID=945733 RepID=A0A563VTZ1_9CYAN|nr:hypothetical protein H1P_30022 [Hyella patelloides LEGE 07179]